MKTAAALLPCLLLATLSQHARAGSMDKDLSDLLHQDDLVDAVPILEKEGITSFERLLQLTDGDVDAIVQKQQAQMKVGGQLKQKLMSMKTGWVSHCQALQSGLLAMSDASKCVGYSA
jgi:hypothetical protein